MKVTGDDVDVILVGGGSIILPERLEGARSVEKPEYFGTANAIGAAISKVGGTFEKLIDYDKTPRDEALAEARAEAADMAVRAGAVRESVEIIDVERAAGLLPRQHEPRKDQGGGRPRRVSARAIRALCEKVRRRGALPDFCH